MASLINFLGNGLVEIVLFPFRSLAPVWGLMAISLLSGLFFLMVFKWTSNQEALFQAKQRVKAHLLELRLFADDMVLTMRAQKDLFLANGNYIRHTLRPMIFLLVPVVLLLIQLDVRYGLRPLEVGETALVQVRLSPSAAALPAELELPEGLSLASPPLRIPSLREVDWKVRAEAPGNWDLRVVVGGREIAKRVRVGDFLAPVAVQVSQPSLLSALANPAEASLPSDSPVQSITVNYPPRDLEVLGWTLAGGSLQETIPGWAIFFFIVSVVPAYLLKGLFGVEV